MTPDPSASFIVALFGGVIIGVGLGLIFKTRATSGGTDIIAMILGKYIKHIPLGTLLICVDSTIVLIALIAFKDWTIPLYSWLVIYVTGVVMDKVIAGFHYNKAVLIISDHHEEIRQRISMNLTAAAPTSTAKACTTTTRKRLFSPPFPVNNCLFSSISFTKSTTKLLSQY